MSHNAPLALPEPRPVPLRAQTSYRFSYQLPISNIADDGRQRDAIREIPGKIGTIHAFTSRPDWFANEWLFPPSAIVISVLIAILWLSGCAYEFPDYPQRAASECLHSCSERGLTLGADPITDTSTTRKYFDRDFPGEGILPVYVVVENKTPETTFLVFPDQFTLAGAVRERGGIGKAGEDAGSAVGWTGAALVSLPVALIGMGIAVNSANAESNFQRKTLQRRTLSPGQSTCGFVYFRMPSGSRDTAFPGLLRMDVEALQTKTKWTVITTLVKQKGA